MPKIQWKLETRLTGCTMLEALVSIHTMIYEDDTHEMEV